MEPQTSNLPEWTLRYNTENGTFEILRDGIVVGSIRETLMINYLDGWHVARLVKIRSEKALQLEEYVNSHKKLLDLVDNAADNFDLRKASAKRNILRELRNVIKAVEVEEMRIKAEIMERELGKQ